MLFLIAILIFAAVVAVYFMYCASEEKKKREAIIEQRKKYISSIGPNARSIVNNGIHLFFMDDVQQIYGFDESGKLYSFSGLQGISRYKNGLNLFQDGQFIHLGKDVLHEETTIAMDTASVNAIYEELMPILRRYLRTELEKQGISPTHQYEVDGDIYGCDLNCKKFYCLTADVQVHDFSDLLRVTIDDLSNNSLCSSNYLINIYAQDDYFTWLEDEYNIYFDSQDSTYYGILAMFKGIRNRQFS